MSNLRKFEHILNEGISQEDLANTLCHRIEMRYPDIYKKYDYDAMYNAVDDVASFHAGTEELGSSDINMMIRQVFKRLEESEGVAEGSSSKLSSPFEGGKKTTSITPKHKPLVWENMLGTVMAKDPTSKAEPKYFDYKWDDARTYAKVDQCDDLRICKSPVQYQGWPEKGKMALWGIPRQGVAEEKGTLWRVIQSEATGRYHVVKGYNKDIKMFKNKMGAGDFNSKDAAQAKADELNKGIEEGWKQNLAAAGAAGLMALGGGGAHAGGVTLGGGGHTVDNQIRMNQQMTQQVQQQAPKRDLSGFATEYLQKAADPNRFGRFLVSPEEAKAELAARESGTSSYKEPQKPAPSANNGFSKEYLEKAADPNRFGRYLISIEKAQELLKQMNATNEGRLDELKCWDGYKRVPGTKAGDPGSCEEIEEGNSNELSTDLLARYKTAAGANARAADKARNFARGNKRFAGIVKATKKQFDNETKPKKESAIMKGIQNETLGTPYPGTYEQEYGPFKRKGQERTMKIAFEGKKNVSRRT